MFFVLEIRVENHFRPSFKFLFILHLFTFDSALKSLMDDYAETDCEIVRRFTFLGDG